VSILLIDIGNTRVKWARVASGRLTKQRAAAHAGWQAQDFARLVFGRARGIERVIVVSVAGAQVDRRLIAAARRATGVVPEFVVSARRLGGVTTAYAEPWRLGVDRFVAVIGARKLVPRRPVCVVDVGTAMTIDLVDARGRHMGGAIIPGPHLMVGTLLRNTSGILKRSNGASAGRRSLFARNTRAAIDLGARYAVAAVIDRAVEEARATLGVSPRLLLTGGAAAPVDLLVRSAHSNVPDLVLRGLATLI
jgi:type III pantothenate kinase